MEVILLDKIRRLGSLGDQVKVKPGYARNYLIPYGKAVIANEQNKAEFETRRAELEAAQKDILGKAESRASHLKDAKVQITSRASDEGHLFGSVGAREIADALTAAGTEVSRSEVLLPEGPIKAVGEYEVNLSLHPEVTVIVAVSVVAES
ncbi:MAG: 50S ribosomal protein L9 [Gammaproteobacteria bacterium]|nr:50S ribosomal protein L9 [Gammaproteobacteria bacterium]